MTGGKSREAVLDCIVEAVQDLGFDRVRLEMVSPDGAVLSLAAHRGFDDDLVREWKTADDADFCLLRSDPRPQLFAQRNGQPERCCIPLMLRERLIGKLHIDNAHTCRSLSGESLENLSLFANQAVTAEAMRWADSLEALQKTTLAITTEHERKPLLRKIIEQAVKLLGAQSGGLYEYRPEQGDLTVIADYKRPRNVGKVLKIGEGLAGRLVESNAPHMIKDDYNSWDGKALIYGKGRRFGAVLEVPLRWQERILGVLYVDDQVGRKFNEADARLLRLFADEAAISLINASLRSEDSHKLARLEKLAQFTREMMSNLGAMPLQDRLMLIARYAVEILNAETAGVFLVRGGDDLVLEASVGQTGEFEADRIRMKIESKRKGGLTGHIAKRGKIFNAHGDKLAKHWAAARSQDSHTPSGVCYSLLAIPFKERTGETETLIGLLRADNKKDENGEALAALKFTQEDEWILSIFAEAAVVAIESAELVDLLKEQRSFKERLIDSSPDGIIAVDRKGEVTEYNKKAEEILGYPRSEVVDIGMPVSRLYFDPNEPDKIGDMLRAQNGQVQDYETAVRSNQGERIPILHASTWLYDAKAKRVGSVGYFEDLRARKALEIRESLLLQVSNIVARAETLDEGLQSLAERIVSLLGRSFCAILLMDESADSLTLRALSIAGKPELKPSRKRIVLANWPKLREDLEKGTPQVRTWSEAKARPNMAKLSKLLDVEAIPSLLVVPLMVGDRVVGRLDLGELDVRQADFSQKEIDLVSAIASQITVLIDRSQLLETKQRREKLLKTLVETSVHIRAEMEMPKLLHAIVRLAAELVGCQVGGLFLYRPHLGLLELAAIHGLSANFLNLQLSNKESFIGLFAQEAAAIHLDPEKEKILQGLGLQSGALVPLLSGEGDAILFVGDITGPSSLGWVDLEVLRDFATQAAIALRTSRLLDREQRVFSQLAILHQISDYIQAAEDPEKILLTILTGVTASYGLGFNRAMLLMLDETGDHLVGRAGIGELEEDKARSAWSSDSKSGLSDFRLFLQRLESGKIDVTTVGRLISRMSIPLGGDDLFSEVVSKRPVQAIATDEFERVPSPFLTALRVSTPLAVAPLAVKDQVIGILVVDNKFTKAPIVTSDFDSLMTLASTAAIALDNKKLLQQTRSGADKLLSFYTLSSELVTLRDPRQILRVIVEQTQRTAGASWVSVVLIDEAGRESSPIFVGNRPVPEQHKPFTIRKDGVSREVMETGRAFPIENVEREDRGHPRLLRLGVKAAICLPLSLPGRRIGVMWIHYDEPRRFPETEVAALQLYANQAAIAYDSARRLERVANLREASDALAATNEMNEVLRQLVESARSVLEADTTVVWFYDTERDTFIPERSDYSGSHQRSWEAFQKKGPQPRGTAYRIMEQDRFIVEDFAQLGEIERVGDTTRGFIEEVGGKAFQGLALKIGNEKLGVLYAIYSKPRSFDQDDREAALAYANRATLALKKVKLIEQVRRATRAAEAVANVTLLEKRESTLETIAHQTKEATECGAVVLFEYDRRAGEVRHPPTMAGVFNQAAARREEERADYAIVHFMLEWDKPYYIAENVSSDVNFKDKRFAEAESVKSCVALPLKAAGSKVGVMFLNYRKKRSFTQDELDNMKLFANQAAVAIRNAQLYDELSTKLYQQRMLVRLSQELLGAQTAQATMDRAVIFAAAAFKAEFSNLVLPDQEGRLFFNAAFGWEKELIGKYELQPGKGSQTGYTIELERPIAVENYENIDFSVPGIVFSHGICSGLSAPMFREGAVFGAILVHTKKTRRFTEDDEALLRLIANETAIAIESARQHDSSERRSRYLNALYEASKAITAQFGRERREILDQIVQAAVAGITTTDIDKPKAILGTLQLFDENKEGLVLESVYPPEQREKLAHKIGIPISGFRRERRRIGVTGRAILTGKPQLVMNVEEDPDYVVYDKRTKSEIVVPLLDHRNVIGVLNVESDQPAAFDSEDREALQALAELTVVAIQNARQLEELKETRQLANARTTIAWMGIGNAVRRHEMAGYVGTIRTDLKGLTKALEKLSLPDATVKRILDRINRMIRAASNMDNTLSERPDAHLSAILVNKEVVRSWAEELDPPLDLLQVSCSLSDLAKIHANVFWLKRVLDILINNAVGATLEVAERVLLLGTRLGERGGNRWAEIFVEDNGPGIPEDIKPKLFREPIEKEEGEQGQGMGLLVAYAIIQSYKGTMRIEDCEPNGTRLVISLPLEKEAPTGEGPQAFSK